MSKDDAKSIFLNASEMTSAAEREAYLDEASGGDPSMRREVEELLRHHGQLGSFLEPPDSPAAGASEPLEPGTEIGPYRLVERIGEGGFGVVYVAEQTRPVRRRVALKVIKAGMDTREVVARFEAERQALAIMDHPHIARVFDAGSTPRGRPYFVMELVKGIPIQKYCDQCQLTLRDRLALFVEACKAVQHAHQKGIIHRDLKPSNVLVEMQDGKPAPKVIDFGVAKATGSRLTKATFHTRFAQMIGTPLYMSPEQAEMRPLDVDTRSDIYSLGVLLYELLTGTTPLRRERLETVSFDELRKIIREEDAPTPSARLTTLNGHGTAVAAARCTDLRRLVRTIRGELDWIVMKALEKDRTRRYETASALAADVERYLADEPVEAGPPSTLYRARKFSRRNRGKLAIAAAIGAAVLVAGWSVLDRATREATLNKRITSSLAEAELSYREGRFPDVMAAVQRAEGLMAGGAANEELRLRVRRWKNDLAMLTSLEEARLAKSAVKDGRFQTPLADRAYRDAFRVYGVDLENLEPEEAASRIEGSAIKGALVAALAAWIASGVHEPGFDTHRLESLIERIDSDPWRRRFREALKAQDTEGLIELARSADARAQPPTTLTYLANSLGRAGKGALATELLRELHSTHAGDFWINHDLAFRLMQLQPPRAADAIGYYRAAVALRPRSPGALLNLGNALQIAGHLDAAVAEYRHAILLAPDYTEAHSNLGFALMTRGDLDDAIAAFREAIALRPEFILAYNNLGGALRSKGDTAGAIKAYRDAIKATRATIDNQPDIAELHFGLGYSLQDQGETTLAVASYRQAIELKPDYADAHFNLGTVLAANKDLSGAIEAYGKAIEFRPTYALAHTNLGVALHMRGEIDAAIKSYRDAIAHDPKIVQSYQNLGAALRSKGNYDGAVGAYNKAIELRPENAALHVELGTAYKARGDTGRAILAYRAAIRHDARNVAAHYNLGNVLQTEGDFAGAIVAYRAATGIRSDLPQIYGNLGAALRETGASEEAVAAYRRAISLAPATSRRLIGLGLALERNSEFDAAISAYREALALEPDSPELFLQIGIALHKSGQSAEAEVVWKRAFAMRPTDGAFYAAAARPLALLPDAALRNPKRAVELATKARELSPDSGEVWNSLALAHYSARDYDAALEALWRSMALRDGGDGSDWLLMAMVCARLDRIDESRRWYDKATAWMGNRSQREEELLLLRAESEELLKIKKPDKK